MKLTRFLLCLVVSDTLLNGLPIILIGAILLENVSEAQSLVPTRLIGQIHLRRILLFLILIFFIGRVIQLSAEPLEEKQEGST
jgi:hypothetical protein